MAGGQGSSLSPMNHTQNSQQSSRRCSAAREARADTVLQADWKKQVSTKHMEPGTEGGDRGPETPHDQVNGTDDTRSCFLRDTYFTSYPKRNNLKFIQESYLQTIVLQRCI